MDVILKNDIDSDTIVLDSDSNKIKISSDVYKYKASVVDVIALKDIKQPIDGEIRQITGKLPYIVFYVFNQDATEGIEPNDGTVGRWNLLYNEVELEKYTLNTNPENFGNCFSLLYPSGVNVSGIGQFKAFFYNYDARQYAIEAGIGVRGTGYFCKKNDRYYLSDNGWSLGKRSFAFSFWIKVDTNVENSTDNVYILGNTNSGENNKALHIGWRNDSTFTVAFYSNDVNFTLSDKHKFSNNRNKFVHVFVSHNTVNKHSTLWINGDFVGDKGHNGGQFLDNWNMIFGVRDSSACVGIISQTRVWISNSQNQDITNITNNAVQNIYNNEKKMLKDIS